MKLHHIAITVNNLQESAAFYAEHFNFQPFKSFAREDMGAKAQMMRLNDIILELWQFDDMIENADDLSNIRVRGIRHIAFEVENLDGAIAELADKGLTFTETKLGASEHRYSFTKDPNGVAIELYEK